MVIDLYCGLGGWAEGFLAEGWTVIGFDIERHDYGTGRFAGRHNPPADILATLSRFESENSPKLSPRLSQSTVKAFYRGMERIRA